MSGLSNQRLSLIEQHLCGNFRFEHDDSLDQYRKRGLPLDTMEIRDSFYEPRPEGVEEMMRFIDNEPAFDHWPEMHMNRSQLRGITLQQVVKFMERFQPNLSQELADPLIKCQMFRALDAYSYGAVTRAEVHFALYADAIRFMGTEKHTPYLERSFTLEDYGSFSVTEIGHGGNAAGLETTATYDHATREFVINTPTPTAPKMWIGAIAKTANMTALSAKLIVNGKNCGLHCFIIPLRDSNTHQILPNIIIGDMGEKSGANNLDNGFIIFNNYRIPYDTLLDKFSEIDSQGNYVNKLPREGLGMGIILASMYRAKFGVTFSGTNAILKCLQIAVRYAAVRRAFGPPNAREFPILDYPLTRHRLMPHLAKLLASQQLANKLAFMLQSDFNAICNNPIGPEFAENNFICNIAKAITGQFATAASQVCREVCGAHGYSYYSMLSVLRANADALTVLEIFFNQQVARNIFGAYDLAAKGKPTGTQFLDIINTNPKDVMTRKAKFASAADLTPDVLLDGITQVFNQWLLRGVAMFQEFSKNKQTKALAWDLSQVNGFRDMAISFGEYWSAKLFFDRIQQMSDGNNRKVMGLFASLFCVEVLDRNSAILRDGYFTLEQLQVVKSEYNRLTFECGEHAVNVTDAIGVSDKIIGSPLGFADGQVYKHFTDVIEQGENVYQQEDWINFYLNWRQQKFPNRQ